MLETNVNTISWPFSVRLTEAVLGVTKPCDFIGFGAMDVTKPYDCIGFGAMGRAVGKWGYKGYTYYLGPLL